MQGQLYAGSDYGAAQIPLATCERSLSCMDCVLARDPYCGWDKAVGKCIFLSDSQRLVAVPTCRVSSVDISSIQTKLLYLLL